MVMMQGGRSPAATALVGGGGGDGGSGGSAGFMQRLVRHGPPFRGLPAPPRDEPPSPQSVSWRRQGPPWYCVLRRRGVPVAARVSLKFFTLGSGRRWCTKGPRAPSRRPSASTEELEMMLVERRVASRRTSCGTRLVGHDATETSSHRVNERMRINLFRPPHAAPPMA